MDALRVTVALLDDVEVTDCDAVLEGDCVPERDPLRVNVFERVIEVVADVVSDAPGVSDALGVIDGVAPIDSDGLGVSDADGVVVAS